MKPFSQGSGIFITSNGILVTNYHVIKEVNLDLTEAKLPSGAYFKFKKIIGIDEKSDIAILQFDAPKTPSVKSLGDSDKIQSGEKIVAIGAPLGFESTVTAGEISHPKRKLDSMEFIQFTAPISSGSSGGGLFSDSGETLGIITLSIQIPPELQKEVFTQNLNFAVPINIVKKVLNGEEKRFTEGSPQYFYSLGMLAKNKKEYDKAIEYYKRSIAIDNKYVDAYIDLGISYYKKGLYDEELKALKKAIQLNPNNSDAYYYLALAYEDKGLYNLAIAAYKKVLEIKPNDKDAIYQLGILYIVQGEKNKALDLIPKLTELNSGLGNELKTLLNRVK